MRRPLMTALLFAGPALAGGSEHVRLGTDVIPTRQEVRLKLDPRVDAYSGSVRIELDVRKAGVPLRVHAQEMTLARAAVDGAAATHAAGPDNTIEITPARPLATGSAVLTIDFTNEYDRRAVGLYKMARSGEGYLFTQFEADRRAQGVPLLRRAGVQDPLAAHGRRCPPAYDAVSNTPEDAPAPSGTAGRRSASRRRKPLPSYLVALAVGPFELRADRGHGRARPRRHRPRPGAPRGRWRRA